MKKGGRSSCGARCPGSHSRVTRHIIPMSPVTTQWLPMRVDVTLTARSNIHIIAFSTSSWEVRYVYLYFQESLFQCLFECHRPLPQTFESTVPGISLVGGYRAASAGQRSLTLPQQRYSQPKSGYPRLPLIGPRRDRLSYSGQRRNIPQSQCL